MKQKQVGLDLLADIRQVSPLYLNHATVHRTTHLTALGSSFPVRSPTVNFSLNVTVIWNWKVRNAMSPSTPMSPDVLS